MRETWVDFSHFNVRSLCSRFDLFADVIAGGSFDVIGLSETWLNAGVGDDGIRVEGFNIIRSDRNGRGGGVAFYLKNCFKYSLINTNNGNAALEQLWISIKTGGKRLCLGTLYRPPNSNLNECIDELENTLVNIIPEFDFIAFGGDLNVDLSNRNLPGSLSLLNLFNKYGLSQCVKDPTRVTDVTNTLLDLLVCSDSNFVQNVSVINMDDISDHKLVNFTIKISKSKPKPTYKTYRDYSNFDYNYFLDDLRNINWQYIQSLTSIDLMVEFFNNNVINLFNIHAPLKTARITKFPAPWITPNVKFMMKLRDKAFSKYKKLKTDDTWTQYKMLRNQVNITVRAEKKAFLQFTFKRDPKNFWRTIKYLNLSSSCQQSDSLLKIGNSDDFNNFFINSLPFVGLTNHTFIDEQYVNKGLHQAEAFKFALITDADVNKIISCLRSNATGTDGINLKMLLYITPHLTNHICFIINKCLSTGYFPNCWKMANIIPVPKVSNPKQLSDYRPISILPSFSKILERVVANQLTNFLNTYNILPSSQSGFRKLHSTTTALLTITDDILRAWDKNQCSCLILLDYSKAFDTISHDILQTKLKYFGLGEISLNFFINYFSNRSQRVLINNSPSQALNISSGVAQGSILGPLLFSIYTSDFSNFLKFCHSHQYADDTQIYFSFSPSDVATSVDKINQDLNIIADISNSHNLVLNERKTQLILFGKFHSSIADNPQFKISLNGTVLKPINNCKNLGLNIDSELRFSAHVSSLIQKTYAKLKLLYMHRDIFNTPTKLRLTDSLVLSPLSYCDIVYWPALLQRDRDSLQKLQNACLRFSFNVRKFDHITPSLTESGWLTLKERFELHLVHLVYKVGVNKIPKYLFDKLVKRSDLHNLLTRHRDLYSVPRHSHAFFQRSFSYVAITAFNSLPDHIRMASSSASFCKGVKSILLANRRRR